MAELLRYVASFAGRFRPWAHGLRIAIGLGVALGALCTSAVWLVGQTFGDATPYTAFCFYVPSPAVAASLGALAALAAAARRRRVAVLAAVLSLPPLTYVVGVENRWIPRAAPDAGQRPLRLVHWNVMNGFGRWPIVHGELSAARADIYVLSDVNPHTGKYYDDLVDAPGTLRIQQMLVVARGSIEVLADCCSANLDAFLCRWQFRGRPISLLIVDLDSAVSIPRGPRLERVRELIERYRPDLVVGDFNAPRRSNALRRLPPGYEHAYDAAGAGWSYTWPVPCPLWAIDQCIVGPSVQAVGYELRSSSETDHRMQVLDFVAPAAGVSDP
jgi:endonuclease/exonuclease/phosphatase (EEP) superfamily protein YafD